MSILAPSPLTSQTTSWTDHLIALEFDFTKSVSNMMFGQHPAYQEDAMTGTSFTETARRPAFISRSANG